MTIAVIGAGLMGSAAARHLAMAGADVVLIGPEEPKGDWAAHGGVFASHYDEGRITRTLDADPFWAEVSAAAIGRYPQITAQSGIAFHTPVGGLACGPGDGPYVEAVQRVAQAAGHPFRSFAGAALADRFPYFAFPDGYTGLLDEAGAGYISPRRLAQAQALAAQRQGAKRLVATVEGLSETGQGVTIRTGQAEVRASCALVAAGGWTDHVLGRTPRLHVRPRTVALFELGPSEQARLSGMPSLVLRYPGLEPYLLPPIPYPDGKVYLKLGGDPFDEPVQTQAALNAWYRSGGDPKARDILVDFAHDLLPGLAPEAVTMAPCVTSLTESGHPEIGPVSDRIAVCTGGNGAGAKNSDELGRRGALVVLEQVERLAAA